MSNVKPNLPGFAYHFAGMGATHSLCGRLRTWTSWYLRRWTNNPSEMSKVNCFYCQVALRRWRDRGSE